MKNTLPSISIPTDASELFNIAENSTLTVRITDIREKCYQQVVLSRDVGDVIKVTYKEYSGSTHYTSLSRRNGVLTLERVLTGDAQFNNMLIKAVAMDILIVLRTKRSTKYMKVETRVTKQ